LVNLISAEEFFLNASPIFFSLKLGLTSVMLMSVWVQLEFKVRQIRPTPMPGKWGSNYHSASPRWHIDQTIFFKKIIVRQKRSI
jgi:hypothetical protein